MPKFACAQHALAFLRQSLDAERLASCFVGETAAQRIDAARTALPRVERASQIEPLIEPLSRSEPFQQVATVEERIAARYILARAAVYRAVYEHEPDQA